MDEYRKVKLSEIKIDREKRQRRKLEGIEELAQSIHENGLLQAPVVHDDLTLVAGERRVTALRHLQKIYPDKYDEVVVHIFEALDLATRQVLELEENIRRVDLTWTEMVTAVVNYHKLQSESHEDWTLEKTSARLGIPASSVSRYLQVGAAVVSEDKHVLACNNISAAYNVLSRRQQRAIDEEVSKMEDLIYTPIEVADGQALDVATVKLPTPTADILQGDFNSWAASYTGKRFNFLHCDFPYGINHQRSEQGGAEIWGEYQDTPDTYWTLCKSLAENLPKILYSSAHVMFWLSMEYYSETISFFEKHTDLRIFRIPLIWHKTDNKGILSDPSRRPRHIYETALFMSRGDRNIIKAVSDCYGAPTAKEHHLSEKPEPVLRHFFQMIVDQTTEMLDPTCGAGSAIRAAEALGAKRVLGIELDEKHVETAQTQLQIARNKARLSLEV